MTDQPAPTVTVFGLGEAGAAIAADLVRAGASVHGYDPAPVTTPDGVVRHEIAEAAVGTTDLVLAVTAAVDAETALRQALDRIPPGTVYADLSTSSAGTQRTLGIIAGERGLAFADVALMSTVAGKGLRTPQFASGPGAAGYADLVVPLGADVELVGGQPGEAATRKLLRSVFMKGLAGVVIEAVRAGEAAGLGSWLWDHIVDEVAAADRATLTRLVEGTAPHATRRRDEMEAAAELLVELGVEPVMTLATVDSLRRAERHGGPELPAH